jgi:hypothetical protein
MYDALKHQGEDVVIDPRDKQKWAERQIHWFIEQVSESTACWYLLMHC